MNQPKQDIALVHYQFTFESGEQIDYRLNIDKKNWLLQLDNQERPAWAKMQHNRCSHCTLDPYDYDYCPAALNLCQIGKKWDDRKSFETAHVEADLGGRSVVGDATVQVALSSLVGLLLATSECPYLSFFRPMARFHQPLAKPEDAGVRVLMSYLAYVALLDKKVDNIKQEIEQIYTNVDKVNQFLAGRITNSKEESAPVQALVQLDCLSKLIRLTIDDSFDQLDELFQPYEIIHKQTGS